MAVNIKQEYEKNLNQSRAQEQGLMDRLAAIDEYHNKVSVPVMSERVKGESPIGGLQALMSSITNRAGMRQDISAQQQNSLGILEALAALQQAEADRALQYQKLNQGNQYDLKDILDITKNAKDLGLVYDPETGQLIKDTGIPKEKMETIGLIDEVLSKDTKGITGLLRLGGIIPGSPGVYTKKQVDQIKAQLSVDQREKMKGSGQISDYESKLLADSVAALDPNMSDEDFRRELTKIRDILYGGYAGNDGGEVNGYTIKEIK